MLPNVTSVNQIHINQKLLTFWSPAVFQFYFLTFLFTLCPTDQSTWTPSSFYLCFLISTASTVSSTQNVLLNSVPSGKPLPHTTQLSPTPSTNFPRSLAIIWLLSALPYPYFSLVSLIFILCPISVNEHDIAFLTNKIPLRKELSLFYSPDSMLTHCINCRKGKIRIGLPD